MAEPLPEPTSSADSGAFWAAYVPSSAAPWNLQRVVHLHRRAGFAPTWNEIQRDLADGPKNSIDRLLAGKTTEGVPAEFAATAALLADSAVQSRDPNRLKACWIYRMLFGPDPLGERLTLLWHNHFATSNLKVEDLKLMLAQNEIFRDLARSPFARLLNKVAHHPALLLWLDASANRKEHPNENLARELMELFTLGIGHYTEKDIKEAARALTGWTVTDDVFHETKAAHDPGEKTILGHTGNWTGDDFIKFVLDHPATAERLAKRLCDMLLGDGMADVAAVKALADGLRQHDLDIGWAVEVVVRSQAFFAEANLGKRIVGPVEFLVGAARSLEMFDKPPSTLLLADWSARLGQDLFYPPNVGGWPGGRSWITTQSMILRANYAAELLRNALRPDPSEDRSRPPALFDALGLAERHGHGGSLEDALRFYAQLLLGRDLSPRLRQTILVALAGRAQDLAGAVRQGVTLILASPEYQLC
jgi:hypothetical protein